MGQDTKWITGAAGSLIRALYLPLKFNLPLPSEAVAARDGAPAVGVVRGAGSARYARGCVTGNTLILLQPRCSDPKVPTGDCVTRLFIETGN